MVGTDPLSPFYNRGSLPVTGLRVAMPKGARPPAPSHGAGTIATVGGVEIRQGDGPKTERGNDTERNQNGR